MNAKYYFSGIDERLVMTVTEDIRTGEHGVFLKPVGSHESNPFQPTCTWIYCEDYDFWDTECGEAFCLTDGLSPTECAMKFCPFCGKSIAEKEKLTREMG
jgi:hypothetical protein